MISDIVQDDGGFMIIKIITCHDVYNAGASLQAYALQTYIRAKGHDVEIIDYKPDYLSHHYNLLYVPNPKYDRLGLRVLYLVAKLPGRISRMRSPKKKEFDDFRKRYLRLTNHTYSSNEELKQNTPKADLYIAGSDQIWNPLFQNGRDPAFYLDFVREGKKISYAASFSVDSLPDDLKDEIRYHLQGLDLISVREKSGQKLVKELGLEAEIVCDPVMLVDKELWMKFIDKEMLKNKPYLFLYDFDGRDSARELSLHFSNSEHYSILSYFESDFADDVYESGPVGFINSIFHSELVISNSLHATIFALLFHKDFFVYKRKEDLNTRLIDLLEDMGLSDRLIEDVEDCKYVSYINWNIIDKKIEDNRARSAQILGEFL